jgi:hypothetical protein
LFTAALGGDDLELDFGLAVGLMAPDHVRRDDGEEKGEMDKAETGGGRATEGWAGAIHGHYVSRDTAALSTGG